jgi:2-haloacid dehalogenase
MSGGLRLRALGAVVPSILAFDVNKSLLEIRYMVALFERLFGGGRLVNESYAQLILYSEAMDLAGGPTRHSLSSHRPCGT